MSALWEHHEGFLCSLDGVGQSLTRGFWCRQETQSWDRGGGCLCFTHTLLLLCLLYCNRKTVLYHKHMMKALHHDVTAATVWLCPSISHLHNNHMGQSLCLKHCHMAHDHVLRGKDCFSVSLTVKASNSVWCDHAGSAGEKGVLTNHGHFY